MHRDRAAVTSTFDKACRSQRDSTQSPSCLKLESTRSTSVLFFAVAFLARMEIGPFEIGHVGHQPCRNLSFTIYIYTDIYKGTLPRRYQERSIALKFVHKSRIHDCPR